MTALSIFLFFPALGTPEAFSAVSGTLCPPKRAAAAAATMQDLAGPAMESIIGHQKFVIDQLHDYIRG